MRAWTSCAHQLATFAQDRFVNRTDVWGAYGKTGTFTAPSKYRRGKDKLSVGRLLRHFTGQCVIGIHSTAPDESCRWIAWDIDAHNDGIDAVANWAITTTIADQIRDAGLEPVIEDSNGLGGYHVWVLFDEPIPAELAYRLGVWVKHRVGADEIESFPKQPHLSGARCGNWLRLPGKHHRRDHWSLFYDLDQERWLDGDGAVEALLTAPVNDHAIVEDLRPILPPLPRSASTPITVNAIDTDPACVQDLFRTNIRKAGDRNMALASLCRYWKAAAVPENEAIERAVTFALNVPARFTTADLTDDEKHVNAESVVSSVYSGNYPFACGYMLSHGTQQQPIKCSGAGCRFVRCRIRTEVLPKSPNVKTVPVSELEVIVH